MKWQSAESEHTLASYQSYMESYPSGRFIDVARVRIAELVDHNAYKKACDEDWYSAYQLYIAEFPKGRFTDQARKRIDWLKSQRARPTIEYPDSLKNTWIVNGSPQWEWDTVFREGGGNVAYRVSANGWVFSRSGTKFGVGGPFNISPITRDEVVVPAGGRRSSDYAFWGESETFNGGCAVFTWTGEDAGGHSISLTEKVLLID